MPDSICSLVRSFNDKTPLMLAAQQGNLDCVQTLIEAGAALDLLDRDNFTALDYAQQNQHRDVSVFLMRQKAHNGVDVVEKEDISDKMKLN
jgi:ankyrin repeat protein